MSEEKWKEVPYSKGRYMVSTEGKVFDNYQKKEIKPHMSGVKRRNYHQVTMYIQEKTGKRKVTKRVHSIMAETFLNHEYNGERRYVVDHKDNNPLNNKLSNLQIVSMKVNSNKDRT